MDDRKRKKRSGDDSESDGEEEGKGRRGEEGRKERKERKEKERKGGRREKGERRRKRREKKRRSSSDDDASSSDWSGSSRNSSSSESESSSDSDSSSDHGKKRERRREKRGKEKEKRRSKEGGRGHEQDGESAEDRLERDLRRMMREFPLDVSHDLVRLLERVDGGEAVDVGGIPDRRLKKLLGSIFRSLGIDSQGKSKGKGGKSKRASLYQLPSAAPRCLPRVVPLVAKLLQNLPDPEAAAAGAENASQRPPVKPLWSTPRFKPSLHTAPPPSTPPPLPPHRLPSLHTAPPSLHTAPPPSTPPPLPPHQPTPALPPPTPPNSSSPPSPLPLAAWAPPCPRRRSWCPHKLSPQIIPSPPNSPSPSPHVPGTSMGPAMPTAAQLAAAASLTRAVEVMEEAEQALQESPFVGPMPPALAAEAANATQAEKYEEVERILNPELTAYAILGVTPAAGDSEIKKRYWKASLLVHPDKCSHQRAQEAFLPRTSYSCTICIPQHGSVTRPHPYSPFRPPSTHSYWKASLLVHPDKCSHPRAQEAFLRLNDAVNRLKDPSKRSVVDAEIAAREERKEMERSVVDAEIAAREERKELEIGGGCRYCSEGGAQGHGGEREDMGGLEGYFGGAEYGAELRALREAAEWRKLRGGCRGEQRGESGRVGQGGESGRGEGRGGMKERDGWGRVRGGDRGRRGCKGRAGRGGGVDAMGADGAETVECLDCCREALPGDDELLGTAKREGMERETWMTELPPERQVGGDSASRAGGRGARDMDDGAAAQTTGGCGAVWSAVRGRDGREGVERETWMAELPPKRQARPPAQTNTFFSRSDKVGRGDTSAWTDNPEQRAARAKQQYLEAYSSAANALEGPSADSAAALQSLQDKRTAALVDNLAAQKQAVSLVEQHRKKQAEGAKKKSMGKEKGKGKGEGERGGGGNAGWRMWDREKDLEVKPKAMKWTADGMAQGLSGRFSGAQLGSRKFL
ncbi:unnamed protein product [Closterium sp. NIES-64]|nr:unnamed protein product [Closterium sp. NIES-64]